MSKLTGWVSLCAFVVLLSFGILRGSGAMAGEIVKDADGNDSGFEHVMTFGTKGRGKGQFSYAEDFDLASDGKYPLVTDAVNSNVQVFDKKDGKFVGTFGGKGDADDQLSKPEGRC